MLGLSFYRKVEDLMNKKYIKRYHENGYFCIDDIHISCTGGEAITPADVIITLTMRWGIEGDEKNESKKEYDLHDGLKTVKQVCEALYTIIEFCNQITYVKRVE